MSKSVELRIALGMRGGVSLAVWIGGAGREIDALRRAGLEPASSETAQEGTTDGFWARVCDLAGIDSVVVDVMAGASAGGLNGVIYAASQVYGFHTQELRDAWLDLGDLKEMVRGSGAGNVAAETAGAEVYPSLLHGDGYFFAKTHETLLNWWRRAATAGPIRRPGSISR